MSHNESNRIQVCVMHPEPLVAMGIAAALKDHPAFAVAVAEPNTSEPAPGSIVVTDYEQGLQIACGFAAHARQPAAMPVRVLVMTARDREHDVRHALELGVYGYLPVGCTPQELTGAVLALGRGSRYLSSTAATRMADSLGRESLTLRENEVLALLACGDCNKSIARRLDIAIGTVKAHVKSIMEKLGAASRTQAVTIATQRGLVEVAAMPRGTDLPYWNTNAMAHGARAAFV